MSNFFVKDNAIVYEGAKIGNNTVIDVGAIIYPNVVIGDNCYIGPYCIIGSPTADYYKMNNNHVFKETKIGDNSVIRSNTIIYEDCSIGYNFQTGHHVTIREKSIFGNNCSVVTFKVELILENLLDCTLMYIWAWEQLLKIMHGYFLMY